MVSKGPNHLFMKPAAMGDEAYCIFIPSFGFVFTFEQKQKMRISNSEETLLPFRPSFSTKTQRSDRKRNKFPTPLLQNPFPAILLSLLARYWQ